MGGVVIGGRLRSRLLVGVATMALAAPVSKLAIAQTADKWSPYLEAGGMVGINAHSFGDVDIFLPLWQDQTSLFFGNLHGQFSAAPTQEGNFGLGYRTQLNTDWILGGYGFIDVQNSENDHLFVQGSLGAELLSVDWDFRVNGYLPFNGGGHNVNGSGIGGGNGQLQIIGHNFVFDAGGQKEEFALFGVDGEVGWRVPIFPADGNMDVRLYAGGYYFARSDVDTIAGPRGRIEARLYDIDFLGMQSRLTAQGVIQWDQPRGTQGFAGLELRIPLGALTGSTAPKLNPLDRRMVDRVQRDLDIVTETAKQGTSERIQEVQVDELTVTTHTAVFANSVGTGANSANKGDPTDINDAPTKGQNFGSNAVIVVQGDTGVIKAHNPVQLSNGQAMIGGGSTVDLLLVGGPSNGQTVHFSFPGTRPTVSGDDNTKNLIQMAPGSQNRVTGLDLVGSFFHGIEGHNMFRAIVTDNSVSGGLGSGVEIEAFSDGIPSSSFVHITRNSITNNKFSGIDVYNGISDNIVHSQTVVITSNIANNNGFSGIFVGNRASSAGSRLDQDVTINDNLASNNGQGGIRVRNSVSGGANISQFLEIDPNIVVSNGFDGISLLNEAIGPGSHITQAAYISDNVAASNGLISGGFYANGILDVNAALSGGDIAQKIAVVSNIVDVNSNAGINMFNTVRYGSTISQTAAVIANEVSRNSGNGVYIFNQAATFGAIIAGGTISQAITVAGNDITSNGIVAGSNGIRLGNAARYAGSNISQTAVLSSNLVANNGLDGIGNYNKISNGGFLSQHLIIDPSTIVGNGRNGVYIQNNLTASVIDQTVDIFDDLIAGNVANGILINNHGSSAGGQLNQTVRVGNTTIAENGGGGFINFNRFRSGAGLSQDVSAIGNIIALNNGPGFYIKSTLNGVPGGTTFIQRATILDNQVNNNNGHGIEISAAGNSLAIETQFATIGGNIVTSNNGNGIQVAAQFTSGSSLSQSVAVNNNTVAFNSNRGIDIRAIGYSNTPVVQTAEVQNNLVVSNGPFDGIKVKGLVSGGGSLTQNVLVTGNDVESSSDNGVYVGGFASSASAFIQTVSVANNVVNGAASANGIAVFTDVQSVGPAFASATLYITNNTVQNTKSHGILVDAVVSNATLIEDRFNINGNTITNVSGNGILVNNDVGSSSVLSQGFGPIGAGSIDDNVISLASLNGVIVSNQVIGPGTTLAQNITMDPNIITSNGLHGIYVRSIITSAVVLQTLGFDDNFIAFNTSDGIRVTTFSSGAGQDVVASIVSQSIALDNNTITSNGGHGVYIGSNVSSGSVLTQNVALTDNTITHSGSRGVFVGAYAQSSSSLFQSVDVANNTIDFSGNQGIRIRGKIFDAPTDGITQIVSVTGNTVDHSGPTASAVQIGGYAVGAGGLTQTVVVDHNSVLHAGYNGISIRTLLDTVSDPGTEILSVTNNLVKYVGSDGIRVRTDVLSSGTTLTQTTFSIDLNTITSVGGRGIYVSNAVLDGASLTQGTTAHSATIDDNTVSFASSGGIVVSSTVNGPAASLSQVMSIDPNTILHVGYRGIVIATDVVSSATATQILQIDGNTISDVHGQHAAIGIGVINTVGDPTAGATMSQTLAITDNQATSITATVTSGIGIAIGIGIVNIAGLDSTITRDDTVSSNAVTSLSADLIATGIINLNVAYSAAAITQALNLDDNTVATVTGSFVSSSSVFFGAIGANGIANLNLAVQDNAIVSQAVSIDRNTVSEITGILLANGITNFNVAGDSHSGVSQTATIDNNLVTTISGSVTSSAPGALIATGISNTNLALGYGSTISQGVNIDNNSVASVTGVLLGNGITNVNVAAEESAAITQGATIDNNVVTSITGALLANGIANVNVAAAYNARVSQAVTINDNTVTNIDSFILAVGIGNANVAINGGDISQSALIDPNTVTNIGHITTSSATLIAGGIVDFNLVDGEGSTLLQTISIESNQVSSIFGDEFAVGIGQSNTVRSGGFMSQQVFIGADSGFGNNVTNVSAASVSGSAAGIQLITYLSGFAVATQSVTIADNTVTQITATSGAIGIGVDSTVKYRSFLSQNVDISSNAVTNVTASSGFAAGIKVVTYLSRFASGVQSVGITDNIVTHVSGRAGKLYAVGIAVYTRLTNASNLTQGVVVSGNVVASIPGNGIFVDNQVRGSTLYQPTLHIDDNTITSVGRFGIKLGNFVSNGTIEQGNGQAATIDDNTIFYATGGGITVANVIQAGGALNGTLSMDPNTIQHVFSSGGFGIAVTTDLSGSGAQSRQDLYIQGNTVTDIRGVNGGGILVANRASSGSQIFIQYVNVSGNTVTGVSHGFGIKVYDWASSASITQPVKLGSSEDGGNVVNDIASGNGIELRAVATSATINLGGPLTATSIFGNTVTNVSATGVLVYLHGSSDGVIVLGESDAPAFMVSNFIGPSINGLDGVKLFASAADGNSKVTTYWSITANTITFQGRDGLHAAAYGDNASQFLSITDNKITNNLNDGIFLKAGADATNSYISAFTAGNILSPNGNLPLVTAGPNVNLQP